MQKKKTVQTQDTWQNENLERRAFSVAAQVTGVGVAIEEGGYLKLLNEPAKAHLLFGKGEEAAGVGRCKIPLENLPALFDDPSAFSAWRDSVLANLPDTPEPGHFHAKTGRFLRVDFFTAGEGSDGVFCWSIRDCSGQQEVETDLEEAARSAATAKKQKTHLLAMMSHEVRTPMNAILGMTELLLHTPLSREQWNLLDTAKTAGESLIGILDNVLDISKVESGTLPLARRVFSLPDLVEGLAEEAALAASQAGIEVICEVDPELPTIMEGDPDKVRQVLANLTSNAIKFTSNGSVAVVAGLIGETDKGYLIGLSVEDTGPGIRPEAMDRIFEPFFQTGRPEHGDSKGVGLGLSIVRSFVGLMGGRIDVKDLDGRGTRFEVTFPLFASESDFPKRRASDQEYPEFHGILLSPAERLRSSGAKVLTALGVSHSVGRTSGELSALLQEAPAGKTTMVLVDYRFGELELDWVSHHLSVHGANRELGMVALVPAGYENGDLSGGSVRTFRLPRPLTRRGVAGVLREFSGGAASSEVPEGDEVADTPAPRLDGLHVLLVEDREENRDFLSRVLEGAGSEVDTASDGEIGLLQFKTSGCDLVLTDLDMPAMDGFRLLEEIRRTEEDEGRSRTPVVAITAHADDATAERCFKAGMDAYVTKPVSRYEILRIVRDLAHPDPVVLVVEDDPKTLELSCQILQQRGFRTVGAGTGEEAIRRVVRNGVDAVLLDMSLPDFSGLEVVQRIRTIPKAKDLPVIGVTGHTGADQAERCKEAGCTGFVEKPVKWDLLVEILEGLLHDDEDAVFTPLVEGLARLEASQASHRVAEEERGDPEEKGPRAKAVGE